MLKKCDLKAIFACFWIYIVLQNFTAQLNWTRWFYIWFYKLASIIFMFQMWNFSSAFMNTLQYYYMCNLLLLPHRFAVAAVAMIIYNDYFNFSSCVYNHKIAKVSRLKRVDFNVAAAADFLTLMWFFDVTPLKSIDLLCSDFELYFCWDNPAMAVKCLSDSRKVTGQMYKILDNLNK